MFCSFARATSSIPCGNRQVQHVKYCHSVAICCKKEALILFRARFAIKPRNVPVVRFTSVRVKLQEKLPRAIVPKSCTR